MIKIKQPNLFVPILLGKLVAWVANYKEKIVVHGPTIDITAEQIADQQAAARGIVDKFNRIEQKRGELGEATDVYKLYK